MQKIDFSCNLPKVQIFFNSRNPLRAEDFTVDRQRELNAFIFAVRNPEKLLQVYVDASGYRTSSKSRYWQAPGAPKTAQPETARTTKATTRTATAKGLQIIDYSAKAFAIIGDTKNKAARLKNLGAKFNPHLTCGAGWIVAKSRHSRESLANYLSI